MLVILQIALEACYLLGGGCDGLALLTGKDLLVEVVGQGESLIINKLSTGFSTRARKERRLVPGRNPVVF